MTQEFDLNQPIYQAGQSAMSMANLLAYFVDPNYQRGNLSRISDMHVKVGRPVSFRIDDDLTPVPEGAAVTDEAIRYMLALFSTRNIGQALHRMNLVTLTRVTSGRMVALTFV